MRYVWVLAFFRIENKYERMHTFHEQRRYTRLIDIKWSKVWYTHYYIYLSTWLKDTHAQIQTTRDRWQERVAQWKCERYGTMGHVVSVGNTSWTQLFSHFEFKKHEWTAMAPTENLFTHKITQRIGNQIYVHVHGGSLCVQYFRFKSWMKYK